MSKWDDIVDCDDEGAGDADIDTDGAVLGIEEADDEGDTLHVQKRSLFQAPFLVRPIGSILAKADDGTFFRTPLVFLMGLVAVADVLGSFYLAAVWSKDYSLAIASIGLILAGLGSAQVLVYRARRISKLENSRYPVTPIIVEFFRAGGECTAVTLALALPFFGIEIATAGASAAKHLPVNYGWELILIGPLAGFVMLLLTHYIAEMTVALVAIANTTTPKSDA
jgi:hypothetical protein